MTAIGRLNTQLATKKNEFAEATNAQMENLAQEKNARGALHNIESKIFGLENELRRLTSKVGDLPELLSYFITNFPGHHERNRQREQCARSAQMR